MNEQLQEALKQMIDKSVAAIEKGATIAGEQIPDIVQQYLMWSVAYRAMTVVLAVVVLVVSYKAVFKWADQTPDYGDSWKDGKALAAMFDGFASLFAVILGVASIFGIAKILIAPKVFLIERFMELVK